MVRTGARAQTLERLLIQAGLRPTTKALPPARIEELPSETAEVLLTLFRDLGGQDGAARLRPGKWDLEFEGGLVVELDEQLHFNRYRAMTLAGEWARDLPWRDDYLSYCQRHEADCLADGRWGKRWTNPSCEKLFGEGDPPGIFHGSGAPRWKQRAFYDAIKDAFAFSGRGVRLARLAIYDTVSGGALGSVLKDARRTDSDALLELVEARVAG